VAPGYGSPLGTVLVLRPQVALENVTAFLSAVRSLTGCHGKFRPNTAGANNGFQEIFTSSMTAAAEWGLGGTYGHGVLANYLTHYLRRGGRLLAYRGLEMAQQGRMLSVIAKHWFYAAGTPRDAAAAAELIVANFEKIQGVVAVLRERRAVALADRAFNSSSPRYDGVAPCVEALLGRGMMKECACCDTRHESSPIIPCRGGC
jgi:hypothetical protein